MTPAAPLALRGNTTWPELSWVPLGLAEHQHGGLGATLQTLWRLHYSPFYCHRLFHWRSIFWLTTDCCDLPLPTLLLLLSSIQRLVLLAIISKGEPGSWLAAVGLFAELFECSKPIHLPRAERKHYKPFWRRPSLLQGSYMLPNRSPAFNYLICCIYQTGSFSFPSYCWIYSRAWFRQLWIHQDIVAVL